MSRIEKYLRKRLQYFESFTCDVDCDDCKLRQEYDICKDYGDFLSVIAEEVKQKFNTQFKFLSYEFGSPTYRICHYAVAFVDENNELCLLDLREEISC